MNNNFVWFFIINSIAFVFMGLDKILAIKKKWRISEFTLIFISFLGGSIGEILGMLIFHHKTKHIKFLLLNPLFLLIWLFVCIYFYLQLCAFSLYPFLATHKYLFKILLISVVVLNV